MSPEQMASTRNVDLRTDIWALGVVLYQLTTGVVPFHAESITQLCSMVLQQEPIPPSQARPGLPVELDRVVMRCLQKSPARRYANVAELAAELLPFGADGARTSVDRIRRMLGISTGQPSMSSSPSLSVAAQTANPSFASPGSGPPAAAPGGPLGAGTSASWGRTSSGKKKTSPVVVVLLAGILGLVGGGLGLGFVVHGGQRSSAPSLPESSAVQPTDASAASERDPATIAAPLAPSAQPAPSSDAPTASPSADKVATKPASAKSLPGHEKAGGAIAPRSSQKPATAPANPFGEDRN
jgi:serine/threonine-protein kinase